MIGNLFKQYWWLCVLVLLFTIDAILSFRWYQRSREQRYDDVIFSAAAKYQVDPALIKAVVWKESNFNASVIGKAQEIGLMQIRMIAASEWAKAEKFPLFHSGMLHDPKINTQAGAWLLSMLLKRYKHADNPLPYALADYNAGRTRVLQWNNGRASTNSAAFISQVGFPGTKQYIQMVMQRYALYRNQLLSKQPSTLKH